MSKLYHTVPKELIDALPTGDIEAVRRFRATLDGTEEIYIRDTLPMFDLMTKHMRKGGSEEELRALDMHRAKLAASDDKTSLVTLCLNLAHTIERCLDEAIKRDSPAAYAVREMLSGKRKGDLGAPRWRVPGEIAAALETRRPQLLVPLRNRIKAGETLSNEAYGNTAEIILDYIQHHYVRGSTLSQMVAYDEGVAAVRRMILRAKDDVPIHPEAWLGLLDTVEDVIQDIVHNERAGGGVFVGDGQSRSKSVFSLFG